MSVNHPQSTEHLNKWLKGESSDQEIEEAFGQETLTKYRQILAEIDQWQPSKDDHVFDPILITEKNMPQAKVISLKRMISIAASVLLIMVAGYIYISDQEVIYATNFGETKEVLLPDGKSKATLGPNAKISWDKGSWSDESRSISLVGKALFEVNPGAPFTVNSTNGSVEVLGTTFVVREFQSSMQVVCYEGKVRVRRKHAVSKIVKGGESILYHEKQWEEIKTITDQTPSWVLNQVKFKDAPIIMVINELKALYEIEVDFGNIDLQRRFSGTFPNNNLSQALQIVFGTLNINFQLKENRLILSE